MEYEYLQMSSVHKFCKITEFYKTKREDDENFILQNSQYLPATSCFFKEGPYHVLICHVTLIFYVTVIS